MQVSDNWPFSSVPFPTPEGGVPGAAAPGSRGARQDDGAAAAGTSAPPTELVTIDPANGPQNPSGITVSYASSTRIYDRDRFRETENFKRSLRTQV